MIYVPDFLRHIVFVIILQQVEVINGSRGKADNSDVCLVCADLESVDDVYNELLDNEPVQVVDADGRVDYEYDVTTTAANHCD